MSFNPFAVQCLTCGSQLRVNDPSIIGSIATCPKCQSMVEILPPDSENVQVEPSERPDQTPDFDSQAITEEAISGQEHSSSLGLAPPTISGFSDDEATLSDAPPVSGSEAVSWESDGTRRKRQIGLIVAVSAVSLTVCLAGFGWFISSWQKDQSVVDNLEMQTQEMSSENRQPDQTETVDTSQPPEANDVGVSQTNGETESVNAELGITESEIAESEITEPEPKQSPMDTTSNATAGLPNSPQEKPGTPPEANDSNVPSDLLPVSPLDDMPNPLSTADRGNTTDPNLENVGEVSGMQDLPPGLEQYTRFLLEEGAIEQPNLDAPPSMDELDIDEATRELDSPIAPVRPKEINIDAALAVKLAIDGQGYALPELALLISQITGVPIQIDWVSFDLAQIDLSESLTLPQGWKPANELLQAAIEPLGGELRNEASLVTITLSDQAFSETFAKITELGDFNEGKASAATMLAELLQLEMADGIPVFSSDNRQDQQLSGIVIEALRLVRGVPPKVGSEPLNRWIWNPENPTVGWSEPIKGQSFPQTDTPMSVAEFLRRLTTENGVQALINWEDLAARRVHPEHVFLPHSAATAAETVDEIFTSLGLGARQVDSKHWWIGQDSTYDRLPVVVWTEPLSNASNNAKSLIQERLNQIVTPDSYRLAFDEASRRAFLVLPRYLAAQLPKLLQGVSEVAP